MSHGKFVQIGRVVLLGSNRHGGKLCAIVNIIDANRLLVDGPCSGVKRQVVGVKKIYLTKFVVRIQPGAHTETVKKFWEAEDISKKWADTTWAKRLQSAEIKSKLTDYERYKVAKAKRIRNKIIRSEFGKLMKVARKTSAKTSTSAGKKPAKK